jgi:MFS family permease
MWRALRHRNYRLFFTGQSVSLIGTWLTRTATGWLVFRLTNDAFLLGLAAFAGQIPTFVLSPFAGVMIDRWDRRRVLVWTQVLSAVQSALLAFFAMTHIAVVHVILLNLAQGLINTFDTPARQAFVVEMIGDRDDLPNAIALNSSMVNSARLVGPMVAGVLIALVGEGRCFAIDAASYLAVIASLLAMTVAPRPPRAHVGRVVDELRDGYRYVAGHAPIRSVLLLLALVSLVGTPYLVLMPMIATDVLGGGAYLNGFLQSASGVGALAGAVYLAKRGGGIVGLGRVIALASLAFGAGLIALSRSTSVWLSIPELVVIGFAMIVQMAASNTVLQTLVDEDKRGRVMSFYTMAFFGMLPLGSLLGGSLARAFGAPDTLLAGGIVCLAGAAAFARVLPRLRAARVVAT